MILMRLSGGLGNQLFQYALGRRLAYDRNVVLKLDLSWFQQQTLRTYQLGALNVSADIASSEEIASMTHPRHNGWMGKVEQALQKRMPYYRRRVVREKTLSFDPFILRHVPRNAYLIGYWQSEKYFAEIESLLRQEIQLKGSLSPEYQRWAEKIGNSRSCSLHVRRGDYEKNPHTNQVHGVCSLDYYVKAIQTIREQFPLVVFFVFSDDMDWARQNLSRFAPIDFVELTGSHRDHEEMLLMSSCEHHIIANSSYSWWGAWLNPTPRKTVIAPRQWGLDPAWVPADLIPQDWLRL